MVRAKLKKLMVHNVSPEIICKVKSVHSKFLKLLFGGNSSIIAMRSVS